MQCPPAIVKKYSIIINQSSRHQKLATGSNPPTVYLYCCQQFLEILIISIILTKIQFDLNTHFLLECYQTSLSLAKLRFSVDAKESLKPGLTPIHPPSRSSTHQIQLSSQQTIFNINLQFETQFKFLWFYKFSYFLFFLPLNHFFLLTLLTTIFCVCVGQTSFFP